MSTAREDCIWFDQCGSDRQGKCEDYCPLDVKDNDSDSFQEDTDFPSSELSAEERYYHGILKENAQEYMKVVQELHEGEEDWN